MHKTLFAGGTLLAALLGAAAPATAQESKQGVVVARDPQTGQLRPPTAAERKALVEQAPQAGPPAPLRAEVGIDGSRKVRLDERHQVYSSVTRGADGQPVLHCVHGHGAAMHAPHPQAKERRDETE